jgi:ABC-type branched-subunit amino acid transport system ATPase component
MCETIRIKNLRAITDLEVSNLGQVNLFVGQNSCGKTTFLEGVFFLIGATNPQLPLTANVLRNLPFFSKLLWVTYFHNMDPGVPIEVAGRAFDSGKEESLIIRPLVRKEQALEPVAADVSSREYEISSSEAAPELNGLELEYAESGDPTETTTSTVVLKNGQLVTEGVKEPRLKGYFISPSPPSDLNNRFDGVQQKKRVREVLSLLSEIEHNMSDLRLNRAGILMADVGLPDLFPANLLGGGIGKFLAIALAMLDFQDGIVLIDEIENGLHHSAQQKLWEAILNWARKLNVQVFATTHSYECLTAFISSAGASLFEREVKLYRIERKEETFRAVEYSKKMLAESLESGWEVR